MRPIVELSRDGDHRASLLAGLELAMECLDDTTNGRDRSTILITVRKYQHDIKDFDEAHPQAKADTPLQRAQRARRANSALKVVGG